MKRNGTPHPAQASRRHEPSARETARRAGAARAPRPRPSLRALCLCALCVEGALLHAGRALAEEATALREVVVTASGEALAERHAAVTQKTVIDRAEIESLGGLSIGETIRKLPGIDAGQHTGDGAPAANARGLGRDSVQFLVDGERPSANARYALTTVGRLPSGELERIEILRGASAENGGGAPVTVNLVMRKARPQNSTSLKAAAGVRGSEANGQFTVSRGGGDGGFSWLLPLTVNHHGMALEKTLERRNASGGTPTLRQNERERSPYTLDEFILAPRLTWKSGGDSLTLWPSLYHNEGRRDATLTRSAYADPANGSGLAADGGRVDREDSRLTIARLRADGEKRLTGGGKLTARAAVMDGRRRSDTARDYRDASDTRIAQLNERLLRDETEISAALRLDQPTGEKHDQLASFGLEHNALRRSESQQTSGTGGAGSFTGDFSARERQWTAWAQHEWSPRNALTLTAGLRGEAIRLEAEGRAQNHAQLAPSLAARFDAGGGWILRSSLGAGIKAPKLDEISALTVRGAGANTPLEADRGGNPDLKPERNVNLELAAERHLADERGVLGVNAWLRRTEDFIERRSALEGGRWVERPWNEGTARHYGVEFDAKLRTGHLIKGSSLRAHLTLPRGRVDDARLGLARDPRNLPRYQFTLGYDQALPFWQANAGFQLTHNGRSRTAVPGENDETTRRGTLLDAFVVRRLTANANLRLSAENLLRADTRREAGAAAGNDDWRLASTERGQRTWLLALEGKW